MKKILTQTNLLLVAITCYRNIKYVLSIKKITVLLLLQAHLHFDSFDVTTHVPPGDLHKHWSGRPPGLISDYLIEPKMAVAYTYVYVTCLDLTDDVVKLLHTKTHSYLRLIHLLLASKQKSYIMMSIWSNKGDFL